MIVRATQFALVPIANLPYFDFCALDYNGLIADPGIAFMAYVPGCEFDLFVSYAHVDNEPIEPADHGWVDALIRVLEAELGM